MDYNFKQAAQSFLQLLYPSLCVNCQTVLEKRGVLFCSPCLDQISLMETKGRCRTCFGEFHKGRCDRCIRRPVIICRQLAACEIMGPAHAMLKGMSRGWKPCICAAASLMAYQWLEQKLPIPEYLIPLPVTFWHRHKLGFDPHLLLAKELGKIFSVPVAPCLKKIFDAPHFFTQGELRHRLIAQKKKESILCDHRILLVAPQLDDTLFRSAGTALKEFFPGQVDALAFAIDLE